MVRRDEEDRRARKGEQTPSCCASPAGGNPVRVSARAPGSRPPVRVERPEAEAGRQKPLRREQGRGPQHEVNPAASKHLQRGSRAAHVTAKATTVAGRSGQIATGPSGVWGAARVQGEERNTGGPSARPRSGQGEPYKPQAKSAAVQRESEGAVVLMIAATKNAAGGKGPCFGHARGEGKREGMAGRTGPNDPDVQMHDVQVRQPQGGLWAEAKSTALWQCTTRTARRSDDRREVSAQARGTAVQASSRRPSASRVREIRMHGLRGGPAFSQPSLQLTERR
jgi:hypothetical protein